MSGKRPFGSIRKLPSGRWQARYRVGPKRVVAPETFATKRDASRWLATTETGHARGLRLDPAAGKVTLVAYATAWLDSKTGIGPRTREIYATQIRLHIVPSIDETCPALGELPLNALTPEVIRRWYLVLALRRGKSVAAKAYSRLHQILTQAVDEDILAKNPCRIDHGGTERHPEQRFATLPELFMIADAVPGRYRALVLMAGLTGLRQGELFALRRSAIDLDAGVVSVYIKRLRLASGEVIEDGPKSEAGKRVVSLPEHLVAEVERHLGHFSGPDPGDYVFTSPSGEPIERSNFRDRVWVPATKAIGLEGLRFHDLRHTAGTMAARTGATVKDLMGRLGHASPQAAMIYQHTAADRDRRIAAGLDDMIDELGLDVDNRRK